MTAVAPVVISGNGVWVGWPGMHMENPNEAIPESDPNDRTPTAGLLSRKVRLSFTAIQIVSLNPQRAWYQYHEQRGHCDPGTK